MEKPQLTDNQNGKKRIPHGDGLYVKGLINGLNVLYTVKIGAACSVISDRVYNSIPEEGRPILTPCTETTDASGKLQSQQGHAVFTLELDTGQKFSHEMKVARIEDDVLLGHDLLYNKSVLRFMGASIPCQKISKSVPMEAMEL